MKPRSKIFLNGLVVTLLWFLIILFANLTFHQKLILRRDLTKSKKYSLSDYSIRVIKQLENPLTIKYYLSYHLPPRLKPLRRYFRDLIKEYQIYSPKPLEIKIIDPVGEEADNPQKGEYGYGITESLVRSMADKGIPLSIEESKGRTYYYFSSIELKYLGRKRVLEHIEQPSNLEYRLTSAIDKLISLNPARIGFYATKNLNVSMKKDSPFSGLLYQIWKLHPIEILKLEKEELFQTEPELEKDLNKNAISQAFRDECQKHSLYLSPQAKLRKGKDKWLIEDGKKVYLIEKKENRLVVSNPHHPIPDDISILFVMAQGEVPEEAKYEIDRFIQRGGRVIFLTHIFDQQNQVLDVNMDYYWKMPRQYRAQILRGLFQRGQAKQYYAKVKTGLEDFLAHYGLQMESVFLTDPGSCLKTIKESYTLGWVREVKQEEEVYFPEAIRIQQKNANSKYSFVNNLNNNLVFVFAHSYSSSKKEIPFIPLLTTTDHVKVYNFEKKKIRKENMNLNGTGEPEILEVIPVQELSNIPRSRFNYRRLNKKRAIAGMVQGSFEPFYKEAPWEKSFSTDTTAKKESKKKKKKGKENKKNIPKGKKTIIIAVGNLLFVNNMVQEVLKRAYRVKPVAWRFLLQTVEWLDSREDLSIMENKHFERAPLSKLSKQAKQGWSLFFTLAMPFLVLVLGLALLVKQQIRKDD